MRQGVVSAPNGKSTLWHQVSFPRISQWPALHTEIAQGPAASLPGGAFPIHMGTSCESSAPSCPPNLVHVSWMLPPPLQFPATCFLSKPWNPGNLSNLPSYQYLLGDSCTQEGCGDWRNFICCSFGN